MFVGLYFHVSHKPNCKFLVANYKHRGRQTNPGLHFYSCLRYYKVTWTFNLCCMIPYKFKGTNMPISCIFALCAGESCHCIFYHDLVRLTIYGTTAEWSICISWPSWIAAYLACMATYFCFLYTVSGKDFDVMISALFTLAACMHSEDYSTWSLCLCVCVLLNI